MKIVVSDTETDNKHYDKVNNIWLFGGIDVKTGERYHFEPFRNQKQKQEAIRWAKSVDLWVGHNFLIYDRGVLNCKLEHDLVSPDKVIDTYIVSRTVKYDLSIPKGCSGSHSLDAWGRRFGFPKGDFKDFDNYSDEMVSYWNRDLDLNLRLYEHFKKYIYDPEWKKAFRVEHDIQEALERQRIYGFYFDKPKAQKLLTNIKEEMKTLEEEIQADYPPELQHVHTITNQINKNGNEGAHVKKAKEKYDMTNVVGDKLECYSYVPFNPGSPKQRIEKLWAAGWKPFEKTKSHQKFGRAKVGEMWGKTKLDQELYDNKKEHFEYYGWTCSEDNLKTLPAKAPAAARKLAQWLTLEGRRSSLVEWIGEVGEDSRIHGTVFGIGSWTGRMSHTKPNTANISSVWPESKPCRSAVDEVKKRYDTSMRSCWKVPDGSIQVGTDMAGIQLRILADYLARLYDAKDYMNAIVAGKKEDETDIHNVNRRALGLQHIDRDDAKTFNLRRLR